MLGPKYLAGEWGPRKISPWNLLLVACNGTRRGGVTSTDWAQWGDRDSLLPKKRPFQPPLLSDFYRVRVHTSLRGKTFFN